MAGTKMDWPEAILATELLDSAAKFKTELDGVEMLYRGLLDTNTAPSLRDGVADPTVADVGILATIVECLAFEMRGNAENLTGLRELLEAAALEVRMPETDDA